MAVSTDQVREFVIRTLVVQMSLPVDPDTVDDASLGPEGLDLESLGLVELALALESEYSVKIPDDDLERLSGLKFGDFVADIAARIS